MNLSSKVALRTDVCETQTLVIGHRVFMIGCSLANLSILAHSNNREIPMVQFRRVPSPSSQFASCIRVFRCALCEPTDLQSGVHEEHNGRHEGHQGRSMFIMLFLSPKMGCVRM